MIILAFTTSTDHGSVVLMRDKKVAGQIRWSRKPGAVSPAGKSDALILKINSLLKKTKIKIQDLGAIAVDRGPGSFTGCRIAVNAAKTFAYTLNIPIVAVSSLDAMAEGVNRKRYRVPPAPFLCVMDAHKSLVYARWYERADGRLTPKAAASAKSLDELLPLIQKGTEVYGPCPEIFRKAFVKQGAKVGDAYPDAKIIGVFAADLMADKNFSAQTWKDVEPSYIRAPEAVEKLSSK